MLRLRPAGRASVCKRNDVQLWLYALPGQRPPLTRGPGFSASQA